MGSEYAGLVLEAKTCARFLLTRPREPQTKFCLFGSGRSGSTLLVSLLDSHPFVRCEDEILHDRVLLPKLFVRCRSALPRESVYGFKLLTYQLVTVQRIRNPSGFVSWLHESGYRIVYLRRRNILRHALSNLYARHIQAFHRYSTERTPPAEAMRVDPEQLFKWLGGIRRARAFEGEALSGVPHLEVVYEDGLQDGRSHQETVDRVADYLGIQRARVTTHLRKMTPPRLAELVANYDEVRKSVLGTDYEQYLEP